MIHFHVMKNTGFLTLYISTLFKSMHILDIIHLIDKERYIYVKLGRRHCVNNGILSQSIS